jgi:pyruvoyl-dependent arginine decarboxylase (PvlArgDC)
MLTTESRLPATALRPPRGGLLPFGTIHIVRGVGRGPTERAARDSAWLDAGLGNFHLIPLAGAIPPGSQIARGGFKPHPLEYGQRLYGVLASHCESRAGHGAHAGLGWVREPVGGQGLIVDLAGEDADQLSRQLHASLLHMQKQRGVSFGAISTETASIQCADEPVCAVVAAVFRSEPW